MTDKQAFEALKKLPFEFQIGGSLGLKMLGIINREVYDIDIVVGEQVEGNVEEGSDQGTVVIRDGDVKIEVREADEQYVRITNEYGDWNVSLPRYAIEKKKEYVEKCIQELNEPKVVLFGGFTLDTSIIERRMNKHLADINAYEQWIDINQF